MASKKSFIETPFIGILNETCLCIVLFSVWSDDRLVRKSRVKAFYLCIRTHIMYITARKMN